jgi:hypothetical protein
MASSSGWRWGRSSLPFGWGQKQEVYLWEILIPGSLVGLIVGYLTQRYGARKATA